jgi:hypothetical protein
MNRKRAIFFKIFFIIIVFRIYIKLTLLIYFILIIKIYLFIYKLLLLDLFLIIRYFKSIKLYIN